MEPHTVGVCGGCDSFTTRIYLTYIVGLPAPTNSQFKTLDIVECHKGQDKAVANPLNPIPLPPPHFYPCRIMNALQWNGRQTQEQRVIGLSYLGWDS